MATTLTLNMPGRSQASQAQSPHKHTILLVNLFSLTQALLHLLQQSLPLLPIINQRPQSHKAFSIPINHGQLLSNRLRLQILPLCLKWTILAPKKEPLLKPSDDLKLPMLPHLQLRLPSLHQRSVRSVSGLPQSLNRVLHQILLSKQRSHALFRILETWVMLLLVTRIL